MKLLFHLGMLMLSPLWAVAYLLDMVMNFWQHGESNHIAAAENEDGSSESSGDSGVDAGSAVGASPVDEGIALIDLQGEDECGRFKNESNLKHGGSLTVKPTTSENASLAEFDLNLGGALKRWSMDDARQRDDSVSASSRGPVRRSFSESQLDPKLKTYRTNSLDIRPAPYKLPFDTRRRPNSLPTRLRERPTFCFNSVGGDLDEPCCNRSRSRSKSPNRSSIGKMTDMD